MNTEQILNNHDSQTICNKISEYITANNVKLENFNGFFIYGKQYLKTFLRINKEYKKDILNLF